MHVAVLAGVMRPVTHCCRILATFLAATPSVVAADPVSDENPATSTADLPTAFVGPIQLALPAVPVATAAAQPLAEPAPFVVATGPTERVYGEAKMREAGASLGFMVSPKFHSVNVSPSFGWFIADNVQLSVIAGFTNIRAGDDDSNIFSAMLEPSYHYRLDAKTLLFGGMGFGWSYMTDSGNGLTYAIRVGAQFELGKRNLFIPSVSYDFRTNEQDHDNLDLADEASERALRINLGYGTVW